MKRYNWLIVVFCLISTLAVAQRNVRDSAIATPWIGIQYGANWTGGDLAERYGFQNHLGMMAGYKTAKNWVYGLDGNFMFGKVIRMEGIFDELTDANGYIFDEGGNTATVLTFSRGFNANVMIGKVFNIFAPNANSGIYVHAGAGYTQHKMRIETNSQYVPSLELNYKKGYDRYTTGLNFHQFIGYAFMANQGIVNFYGGLYLQQGLTYNRREVFFDQPNTPVSTKQRLDLLTGFKFGWFIPVYKRKPKDFYYN